MLFYNLGLLYWRRGLLDDAAAAFARSDAINPRHLASASRPRAADRLAEVNAARTRDARRRRPDPGGACRSPAVAQPGGEPVDGQVDAALHRDAAVARAPAAQQLDLQVFRRATMCGSR